MHKTPNCDGHWIDVSTLTEPRAAICAKCGAMRHDLRLSDFQEGRYEDDDLPPYPDPPPQRSLLLTWDVLPYVALFVAVVALVNVIVLKLL